MNSTEHKHKKRCVVLPTSDKRDKYSGFLQTSRGEVFRIGMCCKEGGGQVNPKSLLVDPSLQIHLKPFLSSLLGRAQHTQTVSSFLLELQDLTEQAISTTSSNEISAQGVVGINNRLGLRSAVPAQFYQLLLSELEGLGWDRVVDVDAEHRVIIVNSIDEKNRLHELTLRFPIDYPSSPPECSTDIPGKFAASNLVEKKTSFSRQQQQTNGPSLKRQDNSIEMNGIVLDAAADTAQYHLVNIVHQWEDCLKQYQPLWDQLDDIDDRTWVLEPERMKKLTPVTPSSHQGATSAEKESSRSKLKEGRPARRLLYRRIALASHASILFEVEPEFPFRVPNNIRFLGKDSVISPLRLRFGSKVGALWDGSGKISLRENLEKCLGMNLPSPMNHSNSVSNDVADVSSSGNDEEEFRSECAICYTYRLNEMMSINQTTSSTSSMDTIPSEAKSSIPEIVCTNPKCNRSYHNHCLYEWLCGLPNAARSFGTIFGHCPYCFVSISVNLK